MVLINCNNQWRNYGGALGGEHDPHSHHAPTARFDFWSCTINVLQGVLVLVGEQVLVEQQKRV